MAANGRKQVMLSYNSDSREIVSEVYDMLMEAGITTWMDVKGGMGDKSNSSMAKAVEDAEVVCCFMTENYQKSKPCEKELTYAENLGKRIIPCVLVDKHVWKPNDWLGIITSGLQYVNFSKTTKANRRAKVNELIARIKTQAVPPVPAAPYPQ
ncbi:unnamed protein product, partial [Rotaria sp. Silwood2]